MTSASSAMGGKLLRGSLARLPKSFFRRDAETMARELLGRYLVRRSEAGRSIVRIVETEAYLGEKDPASHSFGGRRTTRTETMYRAGGVAYVYFIYGIHHCMNVVTGASEEASAVLVRAGEPIAGLGSMTRHRGLRRTPRAGDLAGGPGKLCQALGVDRSLDGVDLTRGELRVVEGVPVGAESIVTGPRVGVDYAGEAAHWPLRYGIAGNPHVSKPRVDR